MKRVLKNKRGVAMESAILFMFVVLMLGMALTSVISITHLQVKVNDTLLQREVAIEQIGENFVYGKAEFASLESGEQTFPIENYYAVVLIDGSTKTLTLKNKTQTSVLLNIEVVEGNIKHWKYE